MNKHAVFFFILFLSGSVFSQNSNLSVTDFSNAIKDSTVQLLDVRTMGEFNNGHIPNAFVADWTKKEEFTERIIALNKDLPVYTYCQSGARSSAAAEWMKQQGFTVYNLDGGIASWKRNNLNVIAPVSVQQISLEDLQLMLPENKTVIVDVGAPWCPPCKKMQPVIDSISQAKNVQVIKIDGGQQSDLANALSVQSFPTFIIYKNGKETWRKEGIVNAGEIISNL